MTKQEEIREGRYEILQSRLWAMDDLLSRKRIGELSNDGLTMAINKLAADITDETLRLENSQGAVVKVERELPKHSPYSDAQQAVWARIIEYNDARAGIPEHLRDTTAGKIARGKILWNCINGILEDMPEAGYVAVEALRR